MPGVRPPSLEEIRAAADRIREVVLRTPLVPLHDHQGPGRVLLKPEIHQPVASFKLRGVHNAVALLGDERRAAGVSTVSAGNTAQALAWSARHFGVSARSLMPESAPQSKIDAMRALGGRPVLVPIDELFRYLKQRGWEREPYAFIHPWIDRDVLTGHASLGLEILEDCPEVDTVLVSVGGGGLIGGVASAIKALEPRVRIVAVEPEGCPALHASFAAGEPVEVECRTLCDGVAVPYITREMFPLLRRLVDDVVLVPERQVMTAIKRLALRDKLVVEGAGALPLAAALAAPRRGTSVCVITGGNLDTDSLVAILADPTL